MEAELPRPESSSSSSEESPVKDMIEAASVLRFPRLVDVDHFASVGGGERQQQQQDGGCIPDVTCSEARLLASCKSCSYSTTSACV